MRFPLRFSGVAAVALAGGLALAACGSSGSSTQSASPIVSSANGSSAGAAVVMTGNTALGNVLTASDGRTLYGRTKDSPDSSTCNGSCTMIWPPVIVGAHWNLAPGLDRAGFHVITRTDGRRQLAAGTWPLYTFSGDAKAGDTNGEGTQGVWFAVGADNKLIKSAASPTTVAPAPAPTGYGY